MGDPQETQPITENILEPTEEEPPAYYVKQEIEARVLRKVVWNDDEKVLRSKMKEWNRSNNSTDRILDFRLKKSMLGHFLYELNCVQEQEEEIQLDKINMYNIDFNGEENEKKRIKLNNLTEELDQILYETITKNKYGLVMTKKILNKFKILRISCNSMSKFESKRIRKLKQLEFLILAGNGITTINGKNIPENITFLELFANRITKLQELTNRIPRTLLYLGLNRNLLTDHLKLGRSDSLTNLVVLDLGDNNLVDLNQILDLLTNSTPNLGALTLQGNPCSYLPQYFTEIFYGLPELEILDNETISHYESPTIEENLTPGMIIKCYRIIGLKQPKPETFQKKKVTKTFQIELECPLMDEGLRNWEEIRVRKKYHGLPEEEEVPATVEQPPEPTEKGKGKNEKTKQEEKGKKSTKDSPNNKKGKAPKEPEQPNLDEQLLQSILQSDKRVPGASEIVSERMPWSKMIEFKEPALKVFPPNDDLVLLRDAFRSEIIIRVVLLSVLPPEKAKANKPKAPKKGQPQEAPPPPIVPQETVVSREVLAKIPISLKSIKWSTDVLNYSWDIKTPYKAVEADNLKNIQYAAGSKGASKKGSPKTNASKTATEPSTNAATPMPDIITCHLGIGVVRNPITKIELPPVELPV